MIGIDAAQLLDDSRKERLEQRVFEVAEEYSLDVEEELDTVDVKYLGNYVNARTSFQGSEIRIDFDSRNFFEKSKREQKRIILHELIHVKQFNNSLSDWTRHQFDVSDELAGKLDGTIWEDVRSVEGETELILANLFPEMGSSYPYELEEKEREMESLGIDVESELAGDLEEEIENAVDYRQVDGFRKEEDVYIEEGSINGFEYEVAVAGYGSDPEEKVGEYLEGRLSEYLEPEDPYEEPELKRAREPLEADEQYLSA